jgi:hypothetical protein
VRWRRDERRRPCEEMRRNNQLAITKRMDACGSCVTKGDARRRHVRRSRR